jgi:ATP-binding cassette subfamily B multidrug efflux pump
MTLFASLIGMVELGLFGFLGHALDRITTIGHTHSGATLQRVLIILSVIFIGSTLTFAIHTLIKQQVLYGNFAMRLRWHFHRNMLAQSLSFYHDELAGRITTKVMQTAAAVRDTWMILANITANAVAYFLTFAFVTATFDRWLLAPFVIWLCCYSLSAWHFVRLLGIASKAQANDRSILTGRINDAYTNIATVKIFSHSLHEAKYAQSAMAKFSSAVSLQLRIVTSFEVVAYTLSMGLVFGTAGLGLWLWSDGQVGIGAIAATSVIALRFYGISQWLMWEMASLFEQIGTVRDGISMLARDPAVADRLGATPLQITKADISFQSVTFRYNSATSSVIDNLNLHIYAGEKIGLVGRSGAGKSTLINLLLRLYDIGEGRILIDHQDISRVTQQSVRSQISILTQDPSLLHRSVRDNILYGCPDASEAAMVDAARRAEAHDFIMRMSDSEGRHGYEAHVGERGVKLSGGQRQRISIARVLLKDAPILLLDEAMNALDSEVEFVIQKTLLQLMEGKTVVSVAHRLSTIAKMDRLIVLDKGRIVEEGSHAGLLAKRGLYARLWSHQRGGFLVEETENADAGWDPT